MVCEGQFILTETEPVFDGADALRFGRDIYVTLSHVRSHSRHAFVDQVVCERTETAVRNVTEL